MKQILLRKDGKQDGRCLRPRKDTVMRTFRIDRNVYEWLQSQDEPMSRIIRRLLREEMKKSKQV